MPVFYRLTAASHNVESESGKMTAFPHRNEVSIAENDVIDQLNADHLQHPVKTPRDIHVGCGRQGHTGNMVTLRPWSP